MLVSLLRAPLPVSTQHLPVSAQARRRLSPLHRLCSSSPRLSTSRTFAAGSMSDAGAAQPERVSTGDPTASAPIKSSTEPTAGSGQSHAPLHDFCLGIPYAMTAGIVSLLARGEGKWMMVATIVVAGLSSTRSLSTWKEGGSSAPYTALSVIAAAVSAYIAARMLALGVSYVASGIVLVLSLAFTAFGVFNLLSGGNPPPKSSRAKSE